MLRPYVLAGLMLTALPGVAQASQLELSVQLPTIQTSEYHRPYVAIWVANQQHRAVKTLAVWHDRNKWLKDLRQWWRRQGRTMTMPADGISSATRPAGKYTLQWNDQQLALPAGDYWLNVEVAREVGGRETTMLPFHWPPQQATRQQQNGNHELGQLTLKTHP